jgi:hypothetical protein
MIMNKCDNFSWKLVVVYGSPYEEHKVEFIDELHSILARWQGGMMVGGDFNLSRFSSDKNNGRVSLKFVDCFNDWVNKWELVELNPTNRKFTWSNNQEKLILAKLDRIYVSTD